MNGLPDSPGCRLVRLQPIALTLQTFDQDLEITHSRPESSVLQNQTIVPIHSVTQQRLGHTNSVEILRTCEG